MIEVNFPNNIAQCKFRGPLDKKYDFKVPKNLRERIKVGDIVVVGTANGLSVAQVVGTLVSSRTATRYVVDIVDVAAYTEAVENEKRSETLRKMLEEKRAQFEKKKVFESLAATDPEAAQMLEALKELEG